MLRLIRTTPVSTDLADYLEQHVGNPPNEARCIEAYFALRERPLNDGVRRYAESFLAVAQKDWVGAIEGIIAALRDDKRRAELAAWTGRS